MTVQSWASYVTSFALVIALIFLLRFAIGYLQPRLGRRGRTAHLSVVETLVVDSKRRLTLFRCDHRTGLILMGGETDLFLGWVSPDTEGAGLKQAESSASSLPEAFQ
ncbi:hypothetical protein [Asaia sp. HN010]|uniref:hypothetical protein n=1 Tax=Asaia sp. HN010 TaxID=3081233 RepID=UPI0030175BEF